MEMATANLNMEAEMHLQELCLTRDSGKNLSCLFKTSTFSNNKDDRERIIVRRFKLDELRVEEIQDLEVRLESIESVTKILEEVNKRVLLAGTDNYESGGYVLLSITAEIILKTAKPNGHGDRESWHGSRNAPSELAPNKGFMQESILSVQDIDIQSLVLISKGILSDVLKCLGDNRKHMREFTLSTLDTWPCAAHPNKMVSENLRDIQDYALADISKRLKPYGAFYNNYESWRICFVKHHVGKQPKDSKNQMEMATANLNMEAEMHLQELCLTRDSGKNLSCLFKTSTFSNNKDDRERIIVRRFKLDELRVEEIQDLEVRLESIESVTKILEEVNKRVLLAGTDNYESGGYVLLSITAEIILKTAKPNGHGDRESWHGSRNAPSELAPNKGFMQESILSVQDIDIQSLVLISKDDREMIIVCRFKFEELHIEHIQDLSF
ncbi:hypothetical protein SASPL_123536 [Salvia splendens]|uniref:Uncharacterized protein n=1 Tax=Salvia splendens TaxID=180675 RepID=A0A8X8ZT35_SALSN|nr:hypothetical protein SASPL_123536 [Salvia splendens]